jgi:hypothetical protein
MSKSYSANTLGALSRAPRVEGVHIYRRAIRKTTPPGHRGLRAFYALERRTGPCTRLIAQDHRAVVRTIFSYIAAFRTGPSCRWYASVRQNPQLGCGVILAYPCRPSAVRGLRASPADELDSSEFWGEAHRTPDVRAIRPALNHRGRLIILSFPLVNRRYGICSSATMRATSRRCWSGRLQPPR